MFKHEKLLFHPVAVERPNPQYAAKMYFSMSEPSPSNSPFPNTNVTPPSFS